MQIFRPQSHSGEAECMAEELGKKQNKEKQTCIYIYIYIVPIYIYLSLGLGALGPRVRGTLGQYPFSKAGCYR